MPEPATRAGTLDRLVGGDWGSFVRFGLVGLSGCVTQLTLFTLLTRAVGCDARVAAVLATGVGLCGNFVLHRLWSFKSARSGRLGDQAWRFALVSLLAIGVNVLVLSAVTAETSISELHGEIVAIGFQALVSYFGSRVWAFG